MDDVSWALGGTHKTLILSLEGQEEVGTIRSIATPVLSCKPVSLESLGVSPSDRAPITKGHRCTWASRPTEFMSVAHPFLLFLDLPTNNSHA